MHGLLVIAVCAALVSLPAAAEPEPPEHFVPTLYAGLSFGGPRDRVPRPRLGLRLDPAGLPAAAAAPALAQWELRDDGTELAVAGRPLLALGFAAPGYEESGAPTARSRGVTSGLLGGAVALAATVWLLGNLEDEIAEAVNREVEETAITIVTGPYEDEDQPDPPPCAGVEVGDRCVGGG